LIDAHIQQLGFSIADLAGMLHLRPEDLTVFYGLTITREQRGPHLRLVK
jgi:hypothetical protein